jgi:hypothetical protein
MPADLADTVAATASRLGRPVGHLVREAVAYYLAAAAVYGAAQGEAPAQVPPRGDEIDISLDASDLVKKAR